MEVKKMTMVINHNNKMTVNNFEQLFKVIYEDNKTEFFLLREDGTEIGLSYDYAVKAFVSDDYDTSYDDDDNCIFSADFILQEWELRDLEIVEIRDGWNGYIMVLAAPAIKERTTLVF